ncbi:MAG: hypothetical protein JXN59_11320 [Anaerolineae bacterium]|nr:hypothetical protein [Anaerolineae bacterium]
MHSYHWKRLGERQTLYRYEPYWQGGAPDPAVMPVLFLQPLPPETITPLAEMFREDGLVALYTCVIRDTDSVTAKTLENTLAWLLRTYHPRHKQVIVVGCAGGGVLGYRFVMQGGYARVAFLFTVGSQHRHTQLSALGEAFFEGRMTRTGPLTGAAPIPGQTIIANLCSARMASRLGPENRLVHLPEAVNEILPLEEEALCRDSATYEIMRKYLAGDRLLVHVCLETLQMRGQPIDGERTGPFCFEVNGHRAPFDGVLRVPLEIAYTFDPARTLLGTLAFPYSASGRSVNIDFRLKDLSSQSDGQRRKLLASLHAPLRAGGVSEHMLQDSLGSTVGIQVRCERPQSVLEANYES